MKNAAGTAINVCGYSFESYLAMIKEFHGHVAPGVVIGGLMVDLAKRHLPQVKFFDAVCETRSCLPDAIHLLTPCTVGNGWLRVVDSGRFALSLFEKYTGIGSRVSVDSRKLDKWPELKAFFFKLVPKKEQDSGALMGEIRSAGTGIFAVQKVAVDLESITASGRRAFSVCTSCGEGYPVADGETCLSCQRKVPYSYFSEQGLG